MKFYVVVEWSAEDQAWVTRVPGLNDLSDFGNSKEEALENTARAIELYLKAASDKEIAVPTQEHKPEVCELTVSS